MKRLLCSAALLVGMSVAAEAATYDFSFDNVEGSMPGAVGGYIVLADGDGTFAASSVMLTAAPGALKYKRPYDVLAHLTNISANSFKVSGGVIDLASSLFGASERSAPDTTYRELTLNDTSGLGSQLVFSDSISGGLETADRSNATLAFSAAAVPLPTAAPLLIAGIAGLAALGRKRRAA